MWEFLFDCVECEGGYGLVSLSDGVEGDILDDMVVVLMVDGGYYEVL